MHLIGLAGAAGAGKDTVASILTAVHGWRAFSFSDALYQEVAEAFGVSAESLKERTLKEIPWPRLSVDRCRDHGFRRRMLAGVADSDLCELILTQPNSPREILQRWGTDYRREQDPDYWVRQAEATWWQHHQSDAPPVGMANTSTRFDNELAWIRAMGGHVVRVDRPGVEPESDYISERPVPDNAVDYVIDNSGGIDELRGEVMQMLLSLDLLAREETSDAPVDPLEAD
ncbi:hypothetical protein [Sediminicurvatus halobius]|uniref:Deoxynucleotide monophosphate kinase n=1 Tax=Sediminicurvatus halobius TaxID=2182432 RepID=A0A2U2MY67_9GAMM|nr:hypothetical protein [Spiribacter halobius]PWG61732.1 hypothetical protein DEM34_14795 [Spiribacter halobius]UEX76840.1 hypothetical protein LMH63_12830 [Spiribacter halobius]